MINIVNTSSKYKDNILRLKAEGKTYLEIVDILKCSKSTVSYYSSNKQQENAKLARIKLLPVRKESRKRGVVRNRKYIDDFLKENACIDCGNNDVRVLEFDHVKGIKVGNISNAIRNAWSLDKLKEEINKCEIRCCNCHRIITIERRKQNKNNINQFVNQREEILKN